MHKRFGFPENCVRPQAVAPRRQDIGVNRTSSACQTCTSRSAWEGSGRLSRQSPSRLVSRLLRGRSHKGQVARKSVSRRKRSRRPSSRPHHRCHCNCAFIANSWLIPRGCNRETRCHTTRQRLKRHANPGQPQLHRNQSYDFEQHREARSRMCHKMQRCERVNSVETLMTARLLQPLSKQTASCSM